MQQNADAKPPVLVIDHDYSRYTERLKHLQHSLVHVTRVEDVYNYTGVNAPSLVVLEPEMFQREGYQLFNMFVSKGIPVILQGRTLEFSSFIYNGALDYFVKPLRFPVCISMMKRWLEIIEDLKGRGKAFNGVLKERASLFASKETVKIALIEDTLEDAMAATSALASRFDCAWFKDLDFFVDSLEQGEKYDLILLDLYFNGEKRGYEYLTAIRQMAALMHVPVVMVSAQFAHKSVEMGFELGAADYIEKGIATGIFSIEAVSAKLLAHVADARFLRA